MANELVERDRQIKEYDLGMASYVTALANSDQTLSSLSIQLAERDHQLAERDHQLAERDHQLSERDQQLQESRREVQSILASLSWRITAPLRRIADILRPHAGGQEAVIGQMVQMPPYRVQQLSSVREQRPRIVHALANFMTGGSSRLVIDLIEHLGADYEQEVITFFAPDPPHYTGLLLHSFNSPLLADEVKAYFHRFNPDLLHVHYWGDVDKAWYEQIFAAAEQYGCKIVENVNTPVMPYVSPAVERYVYVSDYVRTTFGKGIDRGVTIHPGSNFALFDRKVAVPIPDDCVGMVYRLEQDKLNEKSIDVFVKIAQRRPGTKLLIVGGGAFLETYRKEVQLQGVEDNFVFTGYVPYDALPALYEQMSIFVAPVWKESFGQVSPFAMSMGIPVIGYNIGAIREIIAEPALLAPPGDSDRLADIAINLLNDRTTRLDIGARNRERSRSLFSVEAMVQQYEILYKELTGIAG